MNNTTSPIRRRRRTLLGTLFALGLLCAGGATQAATVLFSDMSSGNGIPLLFDPAASVVNIDELEIGLNNFNATSIGGFPAVPVDNFVVKITALPGYFITSLDYSEVYDYSVSVGGVAGITLTGLANGSPANPSGAFFTGGSGTNVGISFDTITLGPGVTEVLFSISNTLFAFAPVGTTSITKTAATLTVGTTPVPLPPALGLLGAALVGLATVSARRRI